MITLRKLKLLAHIARWRLTWNQYDLDVAPPSGLGTKFITARRAASMILDGSTVIACGMAGHHRASIFYWALRDNFRRTGHPRDLTICSVGAIGGRGQIPGTIEELGLEGLVKMAIMGHLETVKSFLRLASAGKMELHTLPQGEFAFLIEGQARGVFELETEVGLGTFLDPRVGRGSAVTKLPSHHFIELAANGLRYRLPKINVALISAPYADRHGNIYVRNAACLTEIRDSARAVKANGGMVLVTVAGVIPFDSSEVYLRHDEVDAIVVNAGNEQTASVRQLRYWPMLTVGAKVDEAEALADVKFINDVLGVTPHRGPADLAAARLATTVVASEVQPGAMINIGIGLPEVVSALLYEAGLSKHLTQTTETGVIGGIPMSGVFFGAAINPARHESSAYMFHRYEQELDLACLGMLEVDSDGNVNASRRGEDPLDYVGPGGFTNIASCAKCVVFVGSFAKNAKLRVRNGQIVIDDPGECKFVPAVREITFNGAQALKRGQRVWYVTPVGLFKLNARGLTLVQVMPGIDFKRDILARSSARIQLEDGSLTVASQAILTGKGFTLN